MPILEFICGWMVLLVVFLMGRKTIWGPITGVATQTCWVVYTILTQQYSLLVSMTALGLLYVWVIFRWSRDAKAKTEPRILHVVNPIACANCKQASTDLEMFLGHYRCPRCILRLISVGNLMASLTTRKQVEEKVR